MAQTREERNVVKAAAMQRLRERRRDRHREMIAQFLDRPCVDCGTQYPQPAMEPDHVRPPKVRNIGWWSNGSGDEETLAAELAKCEVRCANCHRIRHAAERGQ